MNTDETRISRSLLTAISITQAIILVAYLLEVIKQERSIPYFLLLTTIIIIPNVIGWILFKSKPETGHCRYISIIGYLSMYTMVLITGDTPMTFVYVLVPAAFLTVCADTRLLILTLVWACSSNLISILYHILVLKEKSADAVADYEIQILATLLFFTFTYLSTRLQSKINKKRMNTVVQQEHMAKETLEQILVVAGTVSTETETVLSLVEQVEDSSNRTTQAMNEITKGTSQTADSIQAQLSQTEHIQHVIEEVESISDNMRTKLSDSHDNITSGMENMDALTESAALVQQINATLNHEMDTLVDSANKALEIIQIIQGITSQTNLLALNASIEAARAGEAGKGFAVVATEITNLAQQTTSATTNIQELLSALQTEASSASQAVDNVVAAGSNQNDLIMNTKETFAKINQAITSVADSANQESASISQLLEVNNELISSVETISSISGEVSATSQEAYELAQNNLSLSNQMKESIETLSSSVAELQS